MTENTRIPLPYLDTKPVGAADFYFAINSTFVFILKSLGRDGLRRYWSDLGTRYFAPVSGAWKSGGLAGIAAYWDAFFKAEPGAEVDVLLEESRVVLDVRVCPAIRHLRAGGREIVPCFCEHCYFMGEATAASSGFTVRIEGGDGSCRQTFHRCQDAPPPQDLSQIRRAASC
jgi:hypothetical protein